MKQSHWGLIPSFASGTDREGGNEIFDILDGHQNLRVTRAMVRSMPGWQEILEVGIQWMSRDLAEDGT